MFIIFIVSLWSWFHRAISIFFFFYYEFKSVGNVLLLVIWNIIWAVILTHLNHWTQHLSYPLTSFYLPDKHSVKIPLSCSVRDYKSKLQLYGDKRGHPSSPLLAPSFSPSITRLYKCILPVMVSSGNRLWPHPSLCKDRVNTIPAAPVGKPATRHLSSREACPLAANHGLMSWEMSSKKGEKSWQSHWFHIWISKLMWLYIFRICSMLTAASLYISINQ